jgi:DNA processing protein
MNQTSLELLALTLTPGLGPVLLARAIARFGSPAAALRATRADLRAVEGIGEATANRIHAGLADAPARADAEAALAASMGVTIISRADPDYPPLLHQPPDAPTILYVRGTLLPRSEDRYPVAIVGSRECSLYGSEQAHRFATAFAVAGLTCVSGGARGIDTAAHTGCLKSNGRTLAVLGCGLAHVYPPQNKDLFSEIARRGAVVSELPLRTPPTGANFPARNRIISGLSLGVVVIEAGPGSGALITARVAAEEHGREVFALPGRVDSPSSRGSHELLKTGGAHLVTDPADVVNLLESAARHLAAGTHAARYAPRAQPAGATERPSAAPAPAVESSLQAAIIAALLEPKTADQLAAETGTPLPELRAELTLLEMQRLVRRIGSQFATATT